MIFVIISSTIFSQTGFGETAIIGNGFSRVLQSPCYNDFLINPASFKNGIYSSFTPDFIISKSGQFEWIPSSFTISMDIMKYFNLGLYSNIIYTKNFSYEFPEDSNEWDHYTQSVITKGSIFSVNGNISAKINNLQLGINIGKIMGISKRIDIFDFKNYKDINDTSDLRNHRGNLYSAGFMYSLNLVNFGGSVKKYNIDDEIFYKFYYGAVLNLQDKKIYVSMEGFNPSIGIVYKRIILGGSYIKEGERKEKNIGFGFYIPIKKNSITLINNIRLIDGKLVGYDKSDIDYHIGLTFEFIE